MRSKVVTPEEMRRVYGAEIHEFPYAFRVKRGDKKRMESPQNALIASLPLPGSPRLLAKAAPGDE